MRLVASFAVGMFLLFVLSQPSLIPAQSLSPKETKDKTERLFASRLLDRLNAERKKAGVPVLVVDEILTKACLAHAEAAAAKGWKQAGSPTQLVDATQIQLTAFAGFGSTDVEGFVKTHLEQGESRARFLDSSANRFGAGVVSKEGKTLVVVMLGQARPRVADIPRIAETILAQVNEARKKEKLSTLKSNELLTKAALAHAQNMVKQNKMAHVLDGMSVNDRMRKVGYQPSNWGENVAMGQSSATEVMEVWLKSPPHRKNILAPAYREIGIGIARHEKTGQLYFCQVFGTSR